MQQIMFFLAEGKASMPPVLVYGGPSTGKTAVLRQASALIQEDRQSAPMKCCNSLLHSQ